MYGSWDLIKLYFPQEDTNKLAENIIKKFGSEEVENQLGAIEVDNSISYEKSLEKFRER